MTTDFVDYRYNEIAKAFVEIYITENKFLAAKMVKEENIPTSDYPMLREKIESEFLARGYTFNERQTG